MWRVNKLEVILYQIMAKCPSGLSCLIFLSWNIFRCPSGMFCLIKILYFSWKISNKLRIFTNQFTVANLLTSCVAVSKWYTLSHWIVSSKWSMLSQVHNSRIVLPTRLVINAYNVTDLHSMKNTKDLSRLKVFRVVHVSNLSHVCFSYIIPQFQQQFINLLQWQILHNSPCFKNTLHYITWNRSH